MKLTSENIAFIKANYLTMTGTSMARKFGVNKSFVYDYTKINGLSTPKSVVFACRGLILKEHSSSTPDMDRIILANYLTMPVKTLAKLIEKSYTFVSTRLRQLNLIIPAEVIAQRKADSQIKLGNVPPNKGKKMSADQYLKSKPTMFKTGHIPANTLSDGIITTRQNHRQRKGKMYKWIRLAAGDWQHLHVYNWEKKFGLVPYGKILRFKDGNSLNPSTDNLELITRTDNMLSNTIHRFPPELKSVIRIHAKLKRTITKARNNGNANIK